MFVWFGGSQLFQIRSRGARISIVSEYDASTDHYAVLDGNFSAHVHKGVDLNAITDVHSGCDIGFLADDAVCSDSNAMTYVYVVPNRRARLNVDIVLDNSRGVDK